MYVAVKGGEKAIDNAHRLLARKPRRYRAAGAVGGADPPADCWLYRG
ncbi:hypothetical protein P4123_06730 [Pseudomonas aeruginosa]|nr:hypothetical protein [Pseudomonas aeruginosa]